MINDERLKTVADSGNAMQCEVSELATELLTLRADRDFWKEQATIEGGRLTDLYAKHPELLPELTEEEKAACDSVSLNIAKMFDEAKAEEAELVSLRAENERLRGALTTIADMSCQCVCQKATSLALDALTPPTKE